MPDVIERKRQLVQIHKDHFVEANWSKQFSDLLAAATRGDAGLSILELPEKTALVRDGARVRYQIKQEGSDLYKWIDVAKDVAVMRAGDDGRSFLYAQNF